MTLTLSEHIRLEVAEVVRRGRSLDRDEPVPGCGCAACLTLSAGGTWDDVEEAELALGVLAGMPPTDRRAEAERWQRDRERLGRSVTLPAPGVLAAAAARQLGATQSGQTSTPARRPLDVDSARTTPIVDLAETLGLGKPVKRGREYAVRCPFHDDNDPSLRLSPDKGTWFCFPCGEGGDAIDLFQRVRGLDFVDAVREMAS
jgi:hypothetical protein